MTRRTSKISGEKYIHFDGTRRLTPFVVGIPVNGKRKYVGAFLSLEDAVLCRDKFLDVYEEIEEFNRIAVVKRPCTENCIDKAGSPPLCVNCLFNRDGLCEHGKVTGRCVECWHKSR